MKVVAIMGSPHKGQGYKIVKEIETELKSLGAVDFTYIFLSDTNLQTCKGCFACIARGERFCPLKDEKEKIQQALLNADGVILSSPGYAQNVSWLMKNFIDRFAHSLHRPKFFNQSLMLVANGGSGLNKVIKALSLTLGGSKLICKLCITTTPWQATDRYKEETQRKIKKSAKKFFQSMNTKNLDTPNLGNLIWFKIFKKLASLSRKNLPADYEYYKEKTHYFYNVKVDPFKNCIANLIANIAVWSMKRKVVFK